MSGYNENLSSAFAQRRYEKISSIVDSTVKKGSGEIFTLTDMLDQVFLNKYLGVPIFLTILWTMFQFAFAVSEPFVVIIEKTFEMLGTWVNQAISDPHLASFVSLGIFGGLGSVLVFIPPVFGLFLALSVLEDSGYMARAAFVMDRFMYRLGLHGRSFIPLMIGFGCNVPAIMAARSMDNEKDRMITILISPLISCSARLPVYVLIAGALYGAAYAGTVVFTVYALGIILAVIMAFLFRRTLFKGEPSPFVLELPNYAVPKAGSAVFHMWSRGKMFLRKAGTIIFGTAIVVWFLSVHPWEAYHRFVSPQPVLGMELLAIALLGLAGNLAVAFILRGHHHLGNQGDRHSDHHDHHHAAVKDANVESALFHVFGDAVSSLGVIVAAVIIWRTGWMLADPLAGALIGAILIAGSWKVIKSSAHIMMEGTPACLDLQEVEENMRRSPGVAEVHDLHVWNLCSTCAILSAHVVTDDTSRISSLEVLSDLKSRLKDEFGIEHTTLQIEHECCERDSVCRTCKF